ncbi:hypothetical protein DPMN_180998 [Dreissena polymorpha]|uniref:Uncharacterized protein n=1 Tax=Dreissena polymorpha TaxID=45954 RepID=A0A9D4I3C7_DREPO|nr:hypothetical protein DPMN_180998 [Dreissena polymorpha]
MSDVDTTTHSMEDMSMTSCNSSDTLGKPNLQTDQKDDQLVFPEPPEDWQFNKFIGELADNIGI